MDLPFETKELLRRARLRWIALIRRLAPTERQRLFALTIVIGGACGLAAVAFHVAIGYATRFAIGRAMAAHGFTLVAGTIAIPALGGLISGLLLQYVVPNARGSGIPQVKIAYVLKGGVVPLGDAIGKFVVSTLQIGTGASLGREGPTVQICAGIAAALGRLAGVSAPNLKRLLPVGAAAGIAAAFNAPIAAVTFTIEEIVGTLDQTVLSGVIVAAAVAAVVERSVLGGHPLFVFPQNQGVDGGWSLLLFAALGVLAAGVSVVFNESLLRLRAWSRARKELPPWTHPAFGGAITGILALTALLVLKSGGITGGGYETLSIALTGGIGVKVLIALCVMKTIATVCSYSSGGAGGIFAPSLFIGGMLGGAVGALDMTLLHHPASTMGAFALVGMGAAFAGIVRAPITSVLIIIEMTSGYSLALPLMIANMSAYALARAIRPTSIYESLLEQDGYHLDDRGHAASTSDVPLKDMILVQREFIWFPSLLGAGEMLKQSSQPGRQEVFPVLDPDARLVGIVTLEDMTTLASHQSTEGLVTAADVMRPATVLRPEDSIRTAFDAMVENHVRELPVTDAESRVVGFVDESAIARAFIGSRERAAN